MNTTEVHRAKSRVDTAFEIGKSLLESPELQSHWARYLCILVSGYLETSIQTLYSEYAKENAIPPVASYVRAQLKGFFNPKMEKVLSVTRTFSSEWADALEEATTDQVKSSIDSVVAVRHQIAHGQNVGISYSIIRQYYNDAVELVRLIEDQCRGT